MQIEVRYFASLVDRTGRPAERIRIEPGTDVAGLWGELTRRHPSLAELAFRPMVACDRVYAGWDSPLAGVREVAFLPPVSGG